MTLCPLCRGQAPLPAPANTPDGPRYWERCPRCGGRLCPDCGGRGTVLDAPGDVLTGHPYWERCSTCDGTGVINS